MIIIIGVTSKKTPDCHTDKKDSRQLLTMINERNHTIITGRYIIYVVSTMKVGMSVCVCVCVCACVVSVSEQVNAKHNHVE